jgi:exodeoxyribonuclease III
MKKSLKIATWNINSVRLRLDQVLRFLADAAPDVLCLQETKCPDPAFPVQAFQKAGYTAQCFTGIKGYNGVAILARVPLRALEPMHMCGREDSRHISARIFEGSEAIDLHNFYVPAGGDIADPETNPKFAHKLAFLDALKRFSAANRATNQRTILVGDLNIAPLEHDVWSHKQLLDVVSHTPIETASLLDIMAEGAWIDVIRAAKPEPEKLYSWWSYRSPDWRAANKGRRLDHIWVGRDLAPTCEQCEIYAQTRGWERPSDHVPVMTTLALG